MKFSFFPLWFRRALRPHPQIPHPWSKYSAKDYLDKKLERFIDYDSGFFVEVGSGDGVNLTNTLYFEKHRNWRGVLVDPLVSNFISCKTHRRKSKSFLAAAVSFQFDHEYIDLLHAGYMTIGLGTESEILNAEDWVLQAISYLPRETIGFRFPAYARTLDSILSEAEAPDRINLLSLDVEGAEIEVLKGINFDRYRFDFILVESREVKRISDFLEKMGYRFVEQMASCDYLFAHHD